MSANVALRVALIGKSEIISRIIAIAKCLRRVMSNQQTTWTWTWGIESHENSSKVTKLSLLMWSDYLRLQWSRWWRRWSWFKDVHFTSSLPHICSVCLSDVNERLLQWRINFVRRCTGCCCRPGCATNSSIVDRRSHKDCSMQTFRLIESINFNCYYLASAFWWQSRLPPLQISLSADELVANLK